MWGKSDNKLKEEIRDIKYINERLKSDLLDALGDKDKYKQYFEQTKKKLDKSNEDLHRYYIQESETLYQDVVKILITKRDEIYGASASADYVGRFASEVATIVANKLKEYRKEVE